MRLTPKSTVRLSTFFAFSRSGGHPQIPSPVSRIAPKPSRLTVRSPPMVHVELAAPLSLEATAADMFAELRVKIAAPVPRAMPRNTRLLTVSWVARFGDKDRGAMPNSVRASPETVNRRHDL